MHQIYEPLLIRDASGKVLPTLALSWAVTSDPTVWEFKLRQGVKFHNGNPSTPTMSCSRWTARGSRPRT